MLTILSPLLLATAMQFPRTSESLLRRFAGGYAFDMASLEFFVDPEGKVLACHNVRFPEADLEDLPVCDRAMGRDVGRGARDHDGAPVHSLVDGPLIFGAAWDAGALAERAPDLVVTVSTMPGSQERLRTMPKVLIDENGGVARCEAEPGSTFASVACSQVAEHQFAVRFGEAGVPVSYLDSLIVDFVRE